jgi:hypothetical protein
MPVLICFLLKLFNDLYKQFAKVYDMKNQKSFLYYLKTDILILMQ